MCIEEVTPQWFKFWLARKLSPTVYMYIKFFAECCKLPSVDLQVSLQGISDSIEVQTQVTKPARASTQQT